MGMCAYHCYEVGGPYISENPNCPIHGSDARWEREQAERDQEQRNSVLDDIFVDVKKADSLDDLRRSILCLIDVIRGLDTDPI